MSRQDGGFKERCRIANERADIVAVAMRLGMYVETKAFPPVALCPFHGDTGRANLTFFQEPGTSISLPRCYCFTCKTMATPIDLIMEVKKCDVFEALDWLQQLLGIIPGDALPLPARVVQRVEVPVTDKRKAVDAAAARLWGEHGIHTRQYLSFRGITDEVLKAYGIGYWGLDASRWSGRFTIPYLDSLVPGSFVGTMVGGRVRGTLHLGELLGEQGTTAPGAPVEGTLSRSGHDGAGTAGGADGGATAGVLGEAGTPLDRDEPKYLYTKGATRHPYLWNIALSRAEQQGYLVICEGEMDGLSVLSALGVDAPATALGGIGALSTVGSDPRLAGLDVTFIADLESPPRYGTEFEAADIAKQARTEKLLAEAIWKLKQANANVRLVHPPSISDGKTDVNDVLMAYGVEGMLDWLLPELDQTQGGGRALI